MKITAPQLRNAQLFTPRVLDIERFSLCLKISFGPLFVSKGSRRPQLSVICGAINLVLHCGESEREREVESTLGCGRNLFIQLASYNDRLTPLLNNSSHSFSS